MAFDINDFYVSGGSVQLINTWTPTVTKFDSSSFYNWEQDDLPLYDLEGRTYHSWEKQGFTTSSVPGMTLVLSCCPTASGNVFTSFDALVNALPDTIRFPMQVEVAALGNLGTLKLQNIKFEGRGALEIVNRAYARTYQASAIVNSVALTQDLNYITEVSSADLNLTLLNSSAVSVSTKVFSGTNDNRINDASSCNRTVVLKPGGDILDVLTVGFDSTTAVKTGFTDNLFQPNPFGTALDNSFATMDIVPKTQLDNATRLNRTSAAANDPCIALLYGNIVSGIEVNNCNGPIYIRGFFADVGDGNGGGNHNKDYAININNSNVVLENCTAVRATKAGFNFTNSKVVLARGAYGYRNYALAGGVRPSKDEGAGLRAVNSEVTLSSTSYLNGDDFTSVFCKNSIGIDLYDSILNGGQRRFTVADSSGVSWLISQYNTKVGIRLNNSVVIADARLDANLNSVGIEAVNSKLYLHEATIERQANEGLLLKGSTVAYNTALSAYAPAAASNQIQQFYFGLNGQNIKAVNSIIEPIYTSAMPTFFGRMYSISSHGASKGNVDDSHTHALPSIELIGSQAELVHLYSIPYDGLSITSPSGGQGPVYGYGIASKNGSKCVLRGSGSYATLVLGPKPLTTQRTTAGLYAADNSVIELTGPTKIAQFGVDALAENQSVIRLGPPRLEDGSIDASGWSLDSTTNHSKIELHSTRACLVANKNSVIDIKDLGDWVTNWAGLITNTDESQATYFNGSHVSAGFLQFYPNPQTDDAVSSLSQFYTQDPSQRLVVAPYQANQGTASLGGVCVRAVNGSVVKAQNVNFPMGIGNQSGIFYDPNIACSRLFIWNIADDSKLEASYLSVSGAYPTSAGYTGPSAVYTSAVGAVAYGAPVGTPDSGSQSILDLYGGSSIARKKPAINYGPFRLYLSPNPTAKLLNYALGTGQIDGIPYQTYAQGYNPSSTLYVSGDDDIYGDASALSGYYHVSAILESGSQYRVIIDESAGNTFSNAKHLASGKCGLGRHAVIYKAKATRGGEGYDTTSPGVGGAGFYSASIFDLGRKN